jgi:hypothetical protein
MYRTMIPYFTAFNSTITTITTQGSTIILYRLLKPTSAFSHRFIYQLPPKAISRPHTHPLTYIFTCHDKQAHISPTSNTTLTIKQVLHSHFATNCRFHKQITLCMLALSANKQINTYYSSCRALFPSIISRASCIKASCRPSLTTTTTTILLLHIRPPAWSP